MRIPNRPSRTEFAAEFSCPPDTVDDAHDFLESIWSKKPAIGPRDRMAIDTAFSELVANIIQSNRGSSIRCLVRVRIDAKDVILTTTDSGRPFVGDLFASVAPDVLAESGRGLRLMKDLTDELSYDRRGDHNEWRLRRALSVQA